MDQEIAGMQAAAQVNQLNQKIQSQDWTRDINYRDQATGLCPSCGQDSGGGKFCQGCGHPMAAAQAAQKFCGHCGTPLTGARFCGERRPAAGTTSWHDHAAAPHIGEHESPGGSFGPGLAGVLAADVMSGGPCPSR
jgi:hypothetical protein